MHSALSDLDLAHLWVVYPGDESYPLTQKITALALSELDLMKGGEEKRHESDFQA